MHYTLRAPAIYVLLLCCCCLSSGRWKATTVAVKIIEHVEGAPGTASSGGKRISVGRESLLATSISHPNVVGPQGQQLCSPHAMC